MKYQQGVGSSLPDGCLHQVAQEGLKHPNHVSLWDPKAILSELQSFENFNSHCRDRKSAISNVNYSAENTYYSKILSQPGRVQEST